MADDLTRRLDSIEARLCLQDLIGRYALAVDDHDLEALGGCFTDHAVFSSPNSPSTQGRAEILAFFAVRFARYGATMHVPHFQVLHELGTHTARGTVVASAEAATGDDTVVTAFRYDDHYVLEDDRWLFRSRLVRTLYAMPLRDLVAGGLAWPERKRWPGATPSMAELPMPRAIFPP